MDEEARWIERGFIEAVLADYADDAPRLVYADWLLSRKEERGELIVAQCLIEREGRSSPGYRRARAREQVLLGRHRARWLKRTAIPTPRQPLLEATFRRGFVTEVALGIGQVRSVAKRLSLLPLEHLRLVSSTDDVVLGDLRWLAEQPFAARLERLTLHHPRCEVTLDAQAAFALAIARQKAGHGAIWGDRFADGFLHPTVLEMSIHDAWSRGHSEFFRRFVLPPRLERLGIVDVRGLEEEVFANLIDDPRSRALASVSFARLEVENAEMLFAHWPFARARRVHVGAEAGAELFAASGALRRVTSFSTTLPLDRPLLNALARAPLEELSALGGIADGCAPSALVDFLEAPRALSSLHLQRVPLRDEDAARLATMESLAGLFELHIADAELTDAGALALFESPTLAEVPVLDLGERYARIARSRERGGSGL